MTCLSPADEILSLIEEQWVNVNKKDVEGMLKMPGGIDPLEGLLFYLYVIKHKPRCLIEFSPNKGYSTKWIALALKHIGQKKSFLTFEINRAIISELKKNLGEPLKDYVEIIEGDAKETVCDTIKSRSLDVEFCFVDSDHSEEFAKYYTKNIFPLLSKKCKIIVHDICVNDKGEPITSLCPFDGSDKEVKKSEGELRVLKELWKQKNITPFFLHSITGGSHEAASAPINQPFYDKIKKITGHSFIGKDICPKTAVFMIE